MSISLISIIVPCYNQSEFMDECLQSVVDQTYQNWECIIVNDGSSDETEKIALQWTAKDTRFQYLKKENGGLSSARNAGLKIANGDWIQFLDCDDLLHPQKFQKSFNVTDHNISFVVSNFQMIYDGVYSPPFCEIGKYDITLKNVILQWDVDFNIPIHTAIFKKDKIISLSFNEDLKAKEDWLFWIDLCNQESIKYQFIDEPLAYYRHNQKSLSKNFKQVYESIHLVNDHIFTNYNANIKELVFKKLNNTVFALNNTNLDQATYIRKLQSTKILKLYLHFRKYFT